MKNQGQEFERSGSTVDLSAQGLRVRTAAVLSEGQAVYVFSSRGHSPLGYSRVVWVREADHARINEAGLSLLNWRRAICLGVGMRKRIQGIFSKKAADNGKGRTEPCLN